MMSMTGMTGMTIVLEIWLKYTPYKKMNKVCKLSH